MASYFDEHNCEPLGEGEQPNHMLHLARLLIDGGYAREWDMEFESISGGHSSPPASKDVVKSLPVIIITAAEAVDKMSCPICLAEYNKGEETRQMPCGHRFHPTCILPWLEKTNSCPVCRQEVPTDNPDYEEFKKQKARKKQKELEIKTLHDSMYG
ncbi:RING-type domain-containing protein [Lamellibrachia satsuma]|nr:RING-type domain-containing protein [Lamellibrachia satsuma]